MSAQPQRWPRVSPVLALPGTLLAFWPSLGGHFVAIAFLDGVRPRLPRASSGGSPAARFSAAC